MRYQPPIYILCVSSHFWPFTKANARGDGVYSYTVSITGLFFIYLFCIFPYCCCCRKTGFVQFTLPITRKANTCFKLCGNINDSGNLEALCVVGFVGKCWGEKQGYLLNPPDVRSTLPR